MKRGRKNPPCSLPQTTERSPCSTFPIWAKSSERNQELMMFEKAISPASRKRPRIANWRQDLFTSINRSIFAVDGLLLIRFCVQSSAQQAIDREAIVAARQQQYEQQKCQARNYVSMKLIERLFQQMAEGHNRKNNSQTNNRAARPPTENTRAPATS